MKNKNTETSNKQQTAHLGISDVSGNAYLIAVKSRQVINQRIVVAKDVFDLDHKVKQSFKSINWWEIRCNYGKIIF